MSSVEAPPTPWIGRAVPRFEDARFVKGEARFVDDLRMPGLLHAAFVRSPYAHARVVGVDAAAARELAGVRLVLAGADIADRVGAFPINPADDAEIRKIMHPVLAVERVRYVGQQVAVVVAETAAQAVDAAEYVMADYEELPPLLEPGRNEPQLHEDAPDNVLLRWRCANGDVDGAFAAADVVVRERVRAPRLIASPLEPRGAIADYDTAEDLLTLWISAQDQHR